MHVCAHEQQTNIYGGQQHIQNINVQSRFYIYIHINGIIHKSNDIQTEWLELIVIRVQRVFGGRIHNIYCKAHFSIRHHNQRLACDK